MDPTREREKMSETRPKKNEAEMTFDELMESWLGLDEPPLPLPDLSLTPEQVRAWEEAHDKARRALSGVKLDAVEMIREQRR